MQLLRITVVVDLDIVVVYVEFVVNYLLRLEFLYFYVERIYGSDEIISIRYGEVVDARELAAEGHR